MAKNKFFNPANRKQRVHRAYFFLLSIIIFLTLILIIILPKDIFFENTENVNQTRTTDNSSQTNSTANTETTEQQTAIKRPIKRIAIIIDDVGYNLHSLQPFLDFPGKLTLAVLPQVTFSEKAARMIFEAEKEAILHLPMEPEGDYDTGPGVITVDMSKQDIFELLEENFASVPLAMGANNHMGSLATADDRVMDIVISFFKEHNKFFIDSKTTPNSVVKKYAELYQVPCLERQVFLDGTNGLDSIRQDINQGMKIAKEYGIAILIGHVQDPSLIEVLKEIYPQLIKQGFELITVSEFLKSED